MQEFRRRGMKALTGRSHQDIERQAIAVRAHFGVSPDDPLPCLHLFESIREKMAIVRGQSSYPLVDRVHREPANTLGQTYYDTNRGVVFISLSERTYGELEEERAMARFTFAHELGHAVLHTLEIVQLGTLPHQASSLNRDLGHKTFFDTEWQANAFSSAILMPAVAIHDAERIAGGRMDEYDLSRQFGTSVSAARYRLNLYRKRSSELIAVD